MFVLFLWPLKEGREIEMYPQIQIYQPMDTCLSRDLLKLHPHLTTFERYCPSG